MSLKSTSPRILYVTPLWLCGPGVRSDNVLRGLQRMGNVEMAVLDTGCAERHLIGRPDCPVTAEYPCGQETRRNKTLIHKIGRNLNPRSHFPDGWRVSDEAMRHLVSSVNEFDLIWFFRLLSADAFHNSAWPRSVVDIDDVPSTSWDRILQVEGGLKKRLLASMKKFSWRRRERLLADRFTVLTVCSVTDQQYLSSLGLRAPIHVIPNGYERPHAEPVRIPATPPRVGFIGNFGFSANCEGIQWFVSKCWSRIKDEVPDARLRLVGLGSEAFKPSGRDIDVLGWLADPADEISTWTLMVVPIWLGAGSRIKVAQGFSQKCPIVSTSFGVQGFSVRNGHELYLADSVELFSRACIKAIREPAQAAEMAERAWRQFLEKWSWEAIHPQIWAAAEDCLRLNHRGATSFQFAAVPR